MKQFAIIGLGSFGVRMLEKLSEVTDEIIIVDKDADIIEKFKDLAGNAFIADALNEQAIEKMVPDSVDAAIVDMGSNIEASILLVNSLKKRGIKEIIVKTDSDERGEVLKIVGATRVVYPDREAALQITPMLVSPILFSFMPIGTSLVMAEVRVHERFVGLTLVQANFRQKFGVNVIAMRKENNQDYKYFTPEYKLQSDDVILVAGKSEEVVAFTAAEQRGKKRAMTEFLRGIFGEATKGKRRG
jgi:trk system potassium uptake protein TrkA